MFAAIDGVLRPGRRAQIVVAAAAVFAAVCAILAAQHLFPRGSPNLDEVAYDAQSRALYSGDLTLPASTHVPYFRPFLSGVRGDDVVFKYQPVWPAFIGASRAVTGSTLPLRALLAAAAVVATYLFARELLNSRRIGAIAAVIVSLSPFVWLLSATLLGYQLSFVLSVGGAAAVARALRLRSTAAACTAGVLLGFAGLHRPFDALIAAAPVLLWGVVELWPSPSRLRLAGSAILGALPAAVLFLAYNWAVMGAPWRLPFNVSGPIDKFGFGWRATFVVSGTGRVGQIHYTPGEALDATWESIRTLPRFVFAGPWLLLLAVYLLARRYRDARAWLLVGMIGTLVVGYVFWWGVANAIEFNLYDALGPFYHYLALGPLAVLAAWGVTILRPTPALVAALVVFGLAWSIPYTYTVLREARDAGNVRAAELALTDAPGRRLVLEDPLLPGDPYVRIANDADVDGTRVVGIDIPSARLPIVERMRDRAPFLVRGYHPPGDPFGPTRRERVPLEIVDGDVVTLDAVGTPRADAAVTSYLRAGTDIRSRPGPTAQWQLRPEELAARSTAVVVGFSYGADDFVECRFEARAAADRVHLLTPCDGWVGYSFPDGATAVAREDVSDRLTVTVAAE